jgi:hypothetical protein
VWKRHQKTDVSKDKDRIRWLSISRLGLRLQKPKNKKNKNTLTHPPQVSDKALTIRKKKKIRKKHIKKITTATTIKKQKTHLKKVWREEKDVVVF